MPGLRFKFTPFLPPRFHEPVTYIEYFSGMPSFFEDSIAMLREVHTPSVLWRFHVLSPEGYRGVAEVNAFISSVASPTAVADMAFAQRNLELFGALTYAGFHRLETVIQNLIAFDPEGTGVPCLIQTSIEDHLDLPILLRRWLPCRWRARFRTSLLPSMPCGFMTLLLLLFPSRSLTAFWLLMLKTVSVLDSGGDEISTLQIQQCKRHELTCRDFGKLPVEAGSRWRHVPESLFHCPTSRWVDWADHCWTASHHWRMGAAAPSPCWRLRRWWGGPAFGDAWASLDWSWLPLHVSSAWHCEHSGCCYPSLGRLPTERLRWLSSPGHSTGALASQGASVDCRNETTYRRSSPVEEFQFYVASHYLRDAPQQMAVYQTSSMSLYAFLAQAGLSQVCLAPASRQCSLYPEKNFQSPLSPVVLRPGSLAEIFLHGIDVTMRVMRLALCSNLSLLVLLTSSLLGCWDWTMWTRWSKSTRMKPWWLSCEGAVLYLPADSSHPDNLEAVHFVFFTCHFWLLRSMCTLSI